MKNFNFILTLLLVIISGFEINALACEGAYLSLNISELYFNDNGKWEMELYYEILIPTCEKRVMDQYSSDISLDSAFLCSKAGMQKLKFTDYFISGRYSIITEDSLINGLLIDSQGDSLCLVIYFDYYGETRINRSILIFGDHVGSHLSKLKPGQSYMHIGDNKYCKTNIPTLGHMNNSNLGTYAFLKGRIFDKDNNPVAGDTSGFGANSFYYDFWLKIDSFGNYSATVYSRIDTIYKLTYYDEVSHASSMNIVPVPYNLDPDSVLFTDIHLLGELVSSDKPAEISVGAGFYPNPAKEKITFETDKKITGNILIISINGDLIENLQVNNLEFVTWQIPQNLENGIYIYKMISSGNMITNGKFVLLK
jgi:hypothetical protein